MCVVYTCARWRGRAAPGCDRRRGGRSGALGADSHPLPHTHPRPAHSLDSVDSSVDRVDVLYSVDIVYSVRVDILYTVYIVYSVN